MALTLKCIIFSTLKLNPPLHSAACVLPVLQISKLLTVMSTRKCNTSSAKDMKIKFLAKKLNLEENDVIIISQKYPNVLQINPEKMSKIVQLLRLYDLNLKDTIKHPNIFAKSYNTLEHRLKQLADYRYTAKINIIRKINMRSKHYDKVLTKIRQEEHAMGKQNSLGNALANLLECSLSEAQELVDNNRVLQESRFSTVKEKLEFLISKGVSLQELYDKVWIVHYPLGFLQERATILDSYGVTPQNFPSYIHVLKCQKDAFEKRIAKWKEEQLILDGCQTKEDYLAKRLECTLHRIEKMILSYPKLSSIGLAKIHAILNYLLIECKFSPLDVIDNPRVLNFSLDTLKLRFEELSNWQNETVSVKLLQLDNRHYKKLHVTPA